MDKKLYLNTSTSLIYQIVAIICGFILPRCFLSVYGSEVNGLVASITQFLSFISLMDLGINAVVKASLYKPLAEKDHYMTSAIMVSAKKFYNKIILIFLIYVIALCFLLPLTVNSSFDPVFTITLIIAMAINIIGQYYFGILNQTIIDADQKLYINSFLQIVTLILNTVISVVLMLCFDVSVQFVKLVSSLIFLLRPLYLLFYVRKHYELDYSTTYSEEPIKQKWNGVYQHIASVILNNTDVIVLTLFSTLVNVSIYNIYSLVVIGVKNIIIAMTSGIQSKMGHLLAQNKTQELNSFFSKMEFSLHSIVIFFFTATAVLIIPFVTVYTSGINDANYIIPSFGLLLTLSQLFYCLRLPYSQLVLAAGHFKQTQASALIEVALNIIISVVLVWNYGLIGVAIGTIVAMGYRTIYYVLYIKKNILYRPLTKFWKLMLTNVIIFSVSYILCKGFSLAGVNYFSWIVLAFQCCFVIGMVMIATNVIFHSERVKQMGKEKLKWRTKR